MTNDKVQTKQDNEKYQFSETQAGYLVNHYSVLGVQPSATPKEIKAAFQKKISQYHPDRLQGMAPELMAKGAEKTKILVRARDILLNPEIRKQYDQLLSEWSGPISQEGIPIIVVGQTGTNALGLLKEISLDSLDEKVLQLSGFDPQIHAFLEQQIQNAKEVTPELRIAFNQSLTRKETFLSIKEGFRADALGFKDRTDELEMNHLETVKANLKSKKKQLPALLQQQLLGITGPDPKGATIISDNKSLSILDVEKQVLKNFKKLEKEYLNLAQEREKVLAQHLALAAGKYYPTKQPVQDKLVIGFTDSKHTEYHWFAFLLKDNEVIEDSSVNKKSLAKAKSLAGAEKFIRAGYSVMVHEVLGLPAKEEMEAVIGKHYDAYLTGKKKTVDSLSVE